MPYNNVGKVLIDAEDIRLSNWTRWINCARGFHEENVLGLYCAGRVYFIASKDIYPGQELMYYYGDHYAYTLGIKYRLRSVLDGIDLDDDWLEDM